MTTGDVARMWERYGEMSNEELVDKAIEAYETLQVASLSKDASGLTPDWPLAFGAALSVLIERGEDGMAHDVLRSDADL